MTYTNHPEVRAALFDIDGTLTVSGPVWQVLIHSPDVARLRKVWLYGTAMPHYMLSKAGVLDQARFRDRWVRLMAWLTTGWPIAQVRAISAQIVQTQLIPSLRPDVVELAKQHKAQGHPVILVSTMFTYVVQGVVEYLGAHAALGSVVETNEAVSTGRISGETCAGPRKIEFAQRYLAQHLPEISLDQCAIYADSGSDISFVAGGGYPVAVYPDAIMRETAQSRGWTIYEG